MTALGKVSMFNATTILLTGLLLWGAGVASAQSDTTPAAPVAPEMPAPQWWLVNPRATSPVSSAWRFHVEAQGALSRTTGNLDGHTIGVTSMFVVRKGIVTNLLQGKINLQEFALEGLRGAFRQKTTNLTELVMVNVVGATQVIGGFVLERDDPEFIEHRLDVFAGIGQTLLNRPTQKLLAFASLGHEDERFIVPGFETDGPIFYASAAYIWTVKPTIYFRQSTEYIQDLKATSDRRINLTFALDVALGKYLYLSPSFESRHDSQTSPLAEKTDTTQMVSFRVVF
jgi:hypothetical protein